MQLSSWMLCSASEVKVLRHSSLYFFFSNDALLLNLLFILLFFFFSDRGSVMKIAQPRAISQPCLYSEMEIYPVSVQ